MGIIWVSRVLLHPGCSVCDGNGCTRGKRCCGDGEMGRTRCGKREKGKWVRTLERVGGKMEGRGATKSPVVIAGWLAGWRAGGGVGAWTTGKARKGNWRAGNIEREDGKYGQVPALASLRAGFGLGQVPKVPTYQGWT